MIGERIRNIREDNDLRQEDLAKILKTTQSYYAKYENNKRQLPIHHLRTLCLYYNITADYFLGLIDKPIKLTERKK